MPGISILQRSKRHKRRSGLWVPDMLTIADSGGTMNNYLRVGGYSGTLDSSGAWDNDMKTCSVAPGGFRSMKSQSYVRYTSVFRPNQVRIRRGFQGGGPATGSHTISFYGMRGAKRYDDTGFEFLSDVILPSPANSFSDWVDISPSAYFDSWKFVGKSNNAGGLHFWISGVEFRANRNP